jgi:sulfur-oxidizing protein SoxB
MNFTAQQPPAVVEGSSHVFLTDAFRKQADSDIAAIRGFRYGTVVRPGSIRLEDLYHFIPIGPMIAKGTIKGAQLKNQLENSIDGSLNPDVAKWTGGWLFNFSGVRADIDPYAKSGERASNIVVMERQTKMWKPLDPQADYTYASYYYARDPDLINVLPAREISVVKGKDGRDLDAVDVVVEYLGGLPNRTTAPQTGRPRCSPSPRQLRSPEVQPWRARPSIRRPADHEAEGMLPWRF